MDVNMFKEEGIENSPLVYRNENYSVFTTSAHIAYYFNKVHDDIMEHIRDIIACDTSNNKKYTCNMFHKSQMLCINGRTEDIYLVTRGGFTLLTNMCNHYIDQELKVKFTEAFDQFEFGQRHEMVQMSRKLKEQSGLLEEYKGMAKPGTKEFFAFAVKEADKVLAEYEDVMSSQAQKIQEQQEKLQEAQYAIAYTESMRSCKEGMIINELAKVITLALRRAGYAWASFGGKTLYKYLRENGYLVKRKGSDYNTPTQKSMELGIFDIKYTPICGETKFFRKATVKANSKGQEYFIAHFIAMYNDGGYIGTAPKKPKACQAVQGMAAEA